jgi:hypothetical protein
VPFCTTASKNVYKLSESTYAHFQAVLNILYSILPLTYKFSTDYTWSKCNQSIETAIGRLSNEVLNHQAGTWSLTVTALTAMHRRVSDGYGRDVTAAKAQVQRDDLRHPQKEPVPHWWITAASLAYFERETQRVSSCRLVSMKCPIRIWAVTQVITKCIHSSMNRSNSVSIASDYGRDDRCSVSAQVNYFPLTSASRPLLDTGVPSLVAKRGSGVTITIHPHLMLKSRTALLCHCNGGTYIL